MPPRDQSRATAARALAQRTTSANARGWYMNDALDPEGQLKVQGVPVTMELVRTAEVRIAYTRLGRVDKVPAPEAC
jgi:hypothetical protein